ncbi:major facilitator superfamily domain-containing protein [Usnea florida]
MTTSSFDNERQPLLPPLDGHAKRASRDTIWQRPVRVILDVKTFLLGNPIIVCTFCLQFCTYFAKHMVEVPTIKLFEQAICNRYYSDQNIYPRLTTSNIDEGSCKISAIQIELATLTGLKFTFDALPALSTALYYGSIADRLGRRLVLALCCVGTSCSLLWILFICYANTNLPVKLVWLSSLFLCVGGSQRVAKGMTFTIIADAVDKSHRTRCMYLLAGIPHLTTLMAPPLSGVLMLIRIWLPFAVSIGALTLGLLISIFMPESLRHDPSAPKSPLLGAADTLTGTDSNEGTVTPAEQLPRGIHDRLPNPSPENKEWWRDIIVLLQMPGLPFCYLLFFLKPLAMISKAFVYQYASYNFHWGLSQTTWLRFSQAGGSSLATLVVLPLLSSLLNRRGLRAQMLDLNVIRLSLLVAVTGFVMLQLSYYSWMLLLALFICGMSEGEEPALQGLATSLIDPHWRPNDGQIVLHRAC